MSESRQQQRSPPRKKLKKLLDDNDDAPPPAEVDQQPFETEYRKSGKVVEVPVLRAAPMVLDAAAAENLNADPLAGLSSVTIPASVAAVAVPPRHARPSTAAPPRSASSSKRPTSSSSKAAAAAAPPSSIASFQIPTPSFAEWRAAIPRPSADVSANPRANEAKWVSGFMRYIRHLLVPVLGSKTALDLATTPARISRAWRRAVTTDGFSADSSEAYETIGDAIVGAAFALYIYARRPGATPNVITNYTNAYLSENKQPEFAKAIGLDAWLLIPVAQTSTVAATKAARDALVADKYLEDASEALISALFAVCSKVHGEVIASGDYRGALTDAPDGFACVRRFITFVYDGLGGLDPQYERGASKSILTSMASIFGLDKTSNVVFYRVGNTYSVRLPPALAAALTAALGGRSPAAPPVPTMLASGFEDDTDAADAAYNKLASLGITYEWLNREREISKAKGSLSDDVFDALKAAAAERGFPKVFFRRIESSKRPDGSITIALRGADVYDRQVVLASAHGRTIPQAKEAAALEFIASTRSSS